MGDDQPDFEIEGGKDEALIGCCCKWFSEGIHAGVGRKRSQGGDEGEGSFVGKGILICGRHNSKKVFKVKELQREFIPKSYTGAKEQTTWWSWVIFNERPNGILPAGSVNI